MAIKLKKLSRVWYAKVIAFIVLAACVAGCLASFTQAYQLDAFDGYFTEDIEYVETSSFRSLAGNYIYYAMDLNYNFKSEENIRNGNTITEQQIQQRVRDAYEEWASVNDIEVYEDGQGYYDENYGAESGTYATSDEISDIRESSSRDVTQPPHIADFLKEYPNIEEIAKGDLIQEQLAEFRELQGLLSEDHYKLFQYKVVDKDYNKKDNLIEIYKTLPVYLICNEGDIQSNNPVLQNSFAEWYRSKFLNSDKNKDIILIGLDKDQLALKEAEWQKNRTDGKMYVTLQFITLIVGAAAFFFLCFVTGRKPEDDEVHLNWINGIWTEAQFIIGLLLLTVPVRFGESNLYRYVYTSYRYHHYEEMIRELSNITVLLFIVCFTVALSIIALFLLSQVRRLKAHRFLEGFISIRAAKKIFKFALEIWHGGKLMTKAVAAAFLIPLIAATWIGVPFLICGLIYLAYKYVNDFNEVADGVKKVKAGALNHQIEVKTLGELKELAEDINSLSSGLGEAVSSELRSERLKSELLSNVSHDIKTPLTSIITYVDLLKKEEIENPNAKEYIDVLDRKSQRLKVLTSDLFEAAKASSGDMPVNLETMDVNALIRQGLGEFDDRLHSADLQMRVSIPEEPVYILADGRLMWRVFENIMSNVVKYAQAGSRVYLAVEEGSTEVILSLKNISATELNIPADELMERFQRGDESRTTEGSGLGLSIANSLVDLQHGKFALEIDGDLFKVIVEMPRAKK